MRPAGRAKTEDVVPIRADFKVYSLVCDYRNIGSQNAIYREIVGSGTRKIEIGFVVPVSRYLTS